MENSFTHSSLLSILFGMNSTYRRTLMLLVVSIVAGLDPDLK